jgi:hypothetical protein
VTNDIIQPITLIQKDYYTETLLDIEDDLYFAAMDNAIPTDDRWFFTGRFIVTIVWEPDTMQKENT